MQIPVEKLCINNPKLMIIEPFYGGSHKNLLDNITENLQENGIEYTLVTLPAKKWHWRARCGALQLYQKIPKVTTETVLFCSSVLSLTELLGLRSDLHKLKKVVYFHENQLVYPVQQIKERDVQYAYNQITTSLAADKVIFNSHFNKTSFFDNIGKITKLIPDCKATDIIREIEEQCEVLYFPVRFPKDICDKRSTSVLHIVWPHRWEFDKAPDDFFKVILKLKKNKFKFKLSVLGETYTDVPGIFREVEAQLSDELVHFGYVKNKSDYFEVLCSSHVVVSTARHEFFGVSVLEAVYCGCLPLVPNALVYPEMYPSESLYSDLQGLYNLLKTFCLQPSSAVKLRKKLNVDFEKYAVNSLLPEYMKLLELGM